MSLTQQTGVTVHQRVLLHALMASFIYW